MRPSTTPRARSARTFQVTFRISRSLWELVELFAARHDLSYSAAVNRLLVMGFEGAPAEDLPRFDGSPSASWGDEPRASVKISFTILDHMLELLDYSAQRNDHNRSAEIRRLIVIPFREPPAEPAREITGHMI